jgi:hypothetical protein
MVGIGLEHVFYGVDLDGDPMELELDGAADRLFAAAERAGGGSYAEGLRNQARLMKELGPIQDQIRTLWAKMDSIIDVAQTLRDNIDS